MSLVTRVIDSPEVLLKGITDPKLTTLVINKIFHQYRRGKQYNKTGVDVIDEKDWDNLIILDACRYDEYVSLTPFDGEVEKIESRGTSSDQWMYGNFNNKICHDIVYISGNKWYLALQEDDAFENELHYYHDVERDVFHQYVPGPDTTTEAAKEFADKYPNKRLIVHYMQLHKPYLGENRDEFEFPEDEDLGLRDVMRKYKIDRDTLLPAYRDNLRIVLDHVEELVDYLDGKTVISSDHGELLGERISPIPIQWYGHPSQLYIDELVEVPWHVVSNDSRKEIHPEPPDQTSDVDFQQVEQNLRNLGYKPQ